MPFAALRIIVKRSIFGSFDEDWLEGILRRVLAVLLFLKKYGARFEGMNEMTALYYRALFF